MPSKSKPTNPLPRRLAAARARTGVSQARLGELAGMDPQVASARINQYERGTHEPKFLTALRLSEVLGIPVAYLYCVEDELAEHILGWGGSDPKARREPSPKFGPHRGQTKQSPSRRSDLEN